MGHGEISEADTTLSTHILLDAASAAEPIRAAVKLFSPLLQARLWVSIDGLTGAETGSDPASASSDAPAPSVADGVSLDEAARSTEGEDSAQAD
jgi:hypothetical protein